MKLPTARKPFKKNDDGSWTCVAGTVVKGPLVRVSIKPGMTFAPGTWFAGIDIVTRLEAEQALDKD